MTKLPERNLDVLRACAVLSVWFSHLIPAAWHREAPALGHLGVLAFFVHTALVLMSSIERAGGNASRGWGRAFYARRAVRIYPLVWATIALCVLANLPYTPTEIVGPRPSLEVIHSWQAIAANVLLVQGVVELPNVISPLWTLPIEMQMYLLLPAAYLLASRRGPAAVLWTIVAVVLGAVALSVSRAPWLPRISVIVFAPCFLAGVLAYAFLRSTSGRLTGRLPGWAWFAIVPLWWIAGFVAPRALLVDWAACIALALGIAATSELPTSIATRAAGQVAKYSFGIYLLHLPAWMIAFDKVDAPPVSQWALYVALLVALPVASYHLIEAPAVRTLKPRIAPVVDPGHPHSPAGFPRRDTPRGLAQ